MPSRRGHIKTLLLCCQRTSAKSRVTTSIRLRLAAQAFSSTADDSAILYRDNGRNPFQPTRRRLSMDCSKRVFPGRTCRLAPSGGSLEGPRGERPTRYSFAVSAFVYQIRCDYTRAERFCQHRLYIIFDFLYCPENNAFCRNRPDRAAPGWKPALPRAIIRDKLGK